MTQLTRFLRAPILIALVLSTFAPQPATSQTSSRAVAGAATPKDKKPSEKPGKKGAAAGDEGTQSDEEEDRGPLTAATFSGLELRGIGPALVSGRVIDLAVHPEHPEVRYAAVASGGVWKTVNAGTTWTPIFDREKSFSIGCITLDPNNPLVVWVGTGENNSQRSVSYGDGVYRSADGGRNWSNVGLGASEHIGKIIVDPRDSDVVYVAAQGPLWQPGGERGVYKTTDSGSTWTRVLEIDEHTGASEVHFDPRDPDVLYAVAYQRARKVWTLIDGGPGSAVYKSEDAGANWRKLTRGLPKGDLGRIGLAISPADPDVVYAIIEAEGKGAGTYRSLDRGENWEKRDSYLSSSPQYYQELVADPHDRDRVYSLDTLLMVSEDGAKTWSRAGEEYKHVDNHALWIDPLNTDHLLVGCDGGIYESFDRAETWRFNENLPITQFYKPAIDNASPFYNVYGGTQDNNTLGGPVRTTHRYGISSREWFVTTGGDGFQPAVDPENPDIVYSESQHGNLVRFDKKTGEEIDIRPREDDGDAPLRWHWDSPLLVSPHRPSRLYFAAQRVYRSEDRGDAWTQISGDLSRQIDRNELEIMGRLWGVDAVAKGNSTSFYGTVVALSESPLAEGLLYAGTDDGLIQVLEPGQQAWRRLDSFPGVPERTYVADVVASRHLADSVFAVLNNHKEGDFKPYLLRSDDRGRTWSSIAGDLPERGSTWVVAEDPGSPDLLFAGTEFGLYFTLDRGGKWIELEGGMPPIAVRDLAIQTRENDLVAATFGRGFYVLDDYTPLRGLTAEALEQPAILFPTKDPWMFIESDPLSGEGKGSQGHAFYTAPNPPLGAVFTYYLKEGLQSRLERRQDRDKKAVKEGTAPAIPTWDELRAEEREQEPKIVLLVADEDGQPVRRVDGKTAKGTHRVTWDLRYPASIPVQLGGGERRRGFGRPPQGPLVAPGRYHVTLAQLVDGVWTELAGPQTFTAKPLAQGTLPAADRDQLVAFQRQTAKLQRAVLGSVRASAEAQTRIDHLRKAAWETPALPSAVLDRIDQAEAALKDLAIRFEGDDLLGRHNEPTGPSIVERVQGIIRGHWSSTSSATAAQHRAYEIADRDFRPLVEALRKLVETDLAAIEAELEAAGAPWTPGRLPRWP